MSPATAALLVAADEQLPEDVGKAGPIGLAVILALLIAAAFLVRSMTTHLKRLPRSFDEPDERLPEVPDTPAELFEPKPGQEVLDRLRRAPRAIEPPRDDDGGRPGTPEG